MSIYDVTDGNITIKPEILNLPGFKEIWDFFKDKGEAYKWLTYIYYVSDFNSPYNIYSPDERIKIINSEFLKDTNYKTTDLIQAGIDKYKQLTRTPSMSFLEACLNAMKKLEDYFSHVDYTLMDDNGKPVYTATSVMKNLGDVGKVIDSINKVQEKVQKEVQNSDSIRGGGDMGKYEE